MEKTCNKCGVAKDLSEFHKHSGQPLGVQSWCKACAKIRNREYYLATPHRNPQRRASNERLRQRGREYAWDYLLQHPCVDCGYTNPIALEFDHVRGEKVESVSQLVSQGSSIETLKAEIDKCEVRCANCHRIVTSQRGNWYVKITE